MIVVSPIEGMTAAAEYVAEHLREEDRDELWQLGRNRPREAVASSIAFSTEAYVATVGGEPVAVMGAHIPALGRYGVPWLLGTRGVDGHAAAYVKWGRRFTEHLLRRCDVLENWALASNRRTLVFLSRIGFDIGKPFTTPYGAEAVVFSMKARRNV